MKKTLMEMFVMTPLVVVVAFMLVCLKFIILNFFAIGFPGLPG